jgi:hypothetical protein
MTGQDKRSIRPARDSGFFQDVSNHFKLILRLMADKRVSPLVKLLPIGSLVYFIVPVDLLIGPIDDAMVIWLGTYLFIELCPPEVVKEYRNELSGVVTSEWRDPEVEQDEVVDAEYREIREEEK